VPNLPPITLQFAAAGSPPPDARVRMPAPPFAVADCLQIARLSSQKSDRSRLFDRGTKKARDGRRKTK
jgi:hypothetical protein